MAFVIITCSISCSIRAQQAPASQPVTEATLLQLFQEGAQVYQAADYRMALSKWQAGLAQARTLGHKPYTGQLLRNLGVVYWYLGVQEQAVTSLEQAAAIFQELNDRQSQAAILNNLGMVYQQLGRYDQALTAYNQALTIARVLGSRQGEGNALGNIANLHIQRGRYDLARTFFDQTVAIAKEIGDQRMENVVLSGLGLVAHATGQYPRAQQLYQQALDIARAIGDRQSESIALAGMGQTYIELGQYEQALETLQQTLTLKRAGGERLGESTTLNSLGIVYHRLRQYETAQGYYEQALTMKRALGDRRGEAMALVNTGTLYDDQDEYEQALNYHQQALAIFRELGDRAGEGTTLMNMGVVYSRQAQHKPALSFYQQALAIIHEIGDRAREGLTLTNIGATYTLLGDDTQARQMLSTGLAICEEIGLPELLWLAQSELAALEAKVNHYDQAITLYEHALETIETMRLGISEAKTRTSFMRNKLEVYDALLTLLSELHTKFPDKGYDRKALEIFERKQGRVFLEEMGKSGARVFAGLPVTLAAQERELEAQIELTRQQLAATRAKPATTQDAAYPEQLQQQVSALKTQQQALQEQVKTDYPRYYALKYPQPVTLPDLQQHVLQPDEFLLLYNVMPDRTLIWFLSRDTLHLQSIPLGEQALQKKVAGLRSAMLDDWGTVRGLVLPGSSTTKKPDRPSFRQISHELYTLLLPEAARAVLNVPRAPSLKGESGKLFHIIPTGPLYALPFETLVTSPHPSPTGEGAEGGVEKTGVRFLIEDIPISYLSSASLMKILRDASARQTSIPRYPVLAFAHPADHIDLSASAGTLRNLRGQSYRSFGDGAFPELPETADEVRAIAELFQAPPESNPLQLREQAAVKTVLAFNDQERLTDYQYLVFATHGVLPNEVDYVTQSALVLAEDFLTMADVFGLRLNARVVSLSACNTGMGTQVKGEGVLGLTRAFMYAGASNVAVTLWAVESLSAKELNVEFFRQVHQGLEPVAALQAAKIRMLRGEQGDAYRSPYYWAPFVLFGDGR